MIPTTVSSRPTSTTAALHKQFLPLMTRVQRHAEVVFRSIRRPHQKEELTAEAVALAWRWFLRLVERGKNVSAFPSALATFACRAARSGRRVCGKESCRDVLSPLAQRRKGFTVSSLPTRSTLGGSVLDEALQDNARTPPDEQAAFRIDWPNWLSTHRERDQRLILDLMVGERTLDVAAKYRLSPGRISQMRREFHAGWERFCAAPAEPTVR
jgi:DNA-directed RNA polymerase specialized sigma24 family protein